MWSLFWQALRITTECLEEIFLWQPAHMVRDFPLLLLEHVQHLFFF